MQRAVLPIAAALISVTLAPALPGAEETKATLSPQAQGPPTNPVEMGLPDVACFVYRASQRPYRGLFETVWGQQAFAIHWPPDVEQVCNQPGPPSANDPNPVHLTQVDRGLAAATFDQMAQSIAGYEASAEVTALTSKFDAVLAGKAKFTP